MTGVFPVVDRGEMFFQDNARVYAVSLESGTPLPGWAETYDGERDGQFALARVLHAARAAVHGHRHRRRGLAVMGQGDRWPCR